MPGETRNEERVFRTGERATLIVSSTEKGRETLREMLMGSAFRERGYAQSGGEARRMLRAQAFDAAVVNAPLPDEWGGELSRFAAEEGLAVLLLVKREQAEEAAAGVSGEGVLTLGKPFSREVFHRALSLLDASQRRVERLLGENRKLRQRLAEAKLIGKAKCYLALYRGLTEAEAHRFIEQEAMDRRITRQAVAQEIVELYGEDESA